MQIKTVVENNSERFDTRVNEYLEDGWELTKRGIVKAQHGALDKFYAELVKQHKTELNPMDAVEVLRKTCDEITRKDCENHLCPLDDWCNAVVAYGKSPATWPGVVTR